MLHLWALCAVMLTAACGPTPSTACGPDTCAGCCSDEGTCVAPAQQGYAVCGADGEACHGCLPGFACVSGTCQRDADAGNVVEPCSASNCAGCCAGDMCLALSSQSNLSCGVNGATCAACLQGYACVSGTCESSSDGGTACGKKGEMCCANDTCFLGLTCSGGVCTTQVAGTDGGTQDAGTSVDGGTAASPVGAACTANAQCSTNECRILAFPGGYCTRACATAADCPAGSTCGQDPNDTSGQQKVCLANCPAAGTTTGCRTDYVCEKRVTLSGAAACTPKCNSPATCGVATQCDPRGFCCGADGFACCNGTTCDTGLSCDSTGYCKPSTTGTDAGTSTGTIGAACTSNGACQSGVCAFEAQGGTAGCATGPCWPGGYCIADCTNSACPSGASCTPYLAANSLCVRNCSAPGGQSTCRTGYVCDLNWIPNSSQAVCVDACNSTADCNSTTLNCVGGFCCGKVTYRCCGGVGGTCPYGGTCGANGYCQ